MCIRDSSYRLNIFDMSSRPVLNTFLNIIKGKIEINDLPVGVYIITIIGKNRHSVIKYFKA